jgi:23S rRNA pseudouridine1911/1915/1917 synthase
MRKPSRGRPSKFSQEIESLYEDDAIIAINKPAGLAAVPIKGSDAPSAYSVVSAMLRHLRKKTYVVHRIDRFTSGVMLFALSERDRDALVRQFLAHTPGREYLAVVRGTLAEPEGTLTHYFRKEGMFQKLTTSRDGNATRADLKYSVERKLKDASLVRVQLVTGLQNQIRVQFSAIGHPVIGDRKHHPEEANEKRIARVALHASHLEFKHPRTRETVVVDSEPPADFKALVRALSTRR